MLAAPLPPPHNPFSQSPVSGTGAHISAEVCKSLCVDPLPSSINLTLYRSKDRDDILMNFDLFQGIDWRCPNLTPDFQLHSLTQVLTTSGGAATYAGSKSQESHSDHNRLEILIPVAAQHKCVNILAGGTMVSSALALSFSLLFLLARISSSILSLTSHPPRLDGTTSLSSSPQHPFHSFPTLASTLQNARHPTPSQSRQGHDPRPRGAAERQRGRPRPAADSDIRRSGAEDPRNRRGRASRRGPRLRGAAEPLGACA